MKRKTRPKRLNSKTEFTIFRLTDDYLITASSHAERHGYIHGFAKAWRHFTNQESADRFFILTQKQLQAVAIKQYSAWMDGIGWKRPRNPESYDCRYWIQGIEEYENNWKLITQKLKPLEAGASAEHADE